MLNFNVTFSLSVSPTRCLAVWSRLASSLLLLLLLLLFLRALLFLSLSVFLYMCVYLAVKPLKVKIVSPNEILTAGVKSPLRCEAYGSSPPGLFAFYFLIKVFLSKKTSIKFLYTLTFTFTFTFHSIHPHCFCLVCLGLHKL